MKELTVGVRDLKTNLSAYIKKAQKGQTILVTSNGKVVVDIKPHTEVEDIETRMRELAKAGVVLWNGKKLRPGKPVVVNKSDKLASDIIIEMLNESLY